MMADMMTMAPAAPAMKAPKKKAKKKAATKKKAAKKKAAPKKKAAKKKKAPRRRRRRRSANPPRRRQQRRKRRSANPPRRRQRRGRPERKRPLRRRRPPSASQPRRRARQRRSKLRQANGLLPQATDVKTGDARVSPVLFGEPAFRRPAISGPGPTVRADASLGLPSIWRALPRPSSQVASCSRGEALAGEVSLTMRSFCPTAGGYPAP